MGSISVGFYAGELRRSREAAGLTQEQLAEKVQYSTSMVGSDTPVHVRSGHGSRALFQTEGYARALLEGDDRQVMARLDRQKLLARTAPSAPSIVMLLGERVLRHPVGDSEVMREQLEHLAEIAARGKLCRSSQMLRGRFSTWTGRS